MLQTVLQGSVSIFEEIQKVYLEAKSDNFVLLKFTASLHLPGLSEIWL